MGINTNVGKINIDTSKAIDLEEKLYQIKTEAKELYNPNSNGISMQNRKSEIEEINLDEEVKIENTNDNEDFLKNITSFAEETTSMIGTTLKKTGATIGTGVVSLVEGVSKFAESIVDVAELAGATIASVGTGLYDGGQALYGMATGQDWESVTKKMWNEVKAFVAEDYVSSAFDNFYEKNTIGQFLKDNSYGFQTVRGISSGIGYIGGTVALTVATCGAGTAIMGSTIAVNGTTLAGTAAVAGMGKGTEKAWSEGASTLEGLGTGALTGAWEGLQFYLGSKIGNTEILAADSVKNKLINSLARISLDGLDGGVEGIVQPLIDSIYKDGYINENGEYIEFTNENIVEKYQELFDDAGGWKNVGIQTAIGAGSSAIGEGLNLRKYFNQNDSVVKKFSIEDLKEKYTRIKELEEIINSEDYKKFIKYADESDAKGWAIRDPKGYSIIKMDYDRISNELSQTYKIGNETFTGYDIANLRADYIKKLKNKNFSKTTNVTINTLESKLNRYNEIIDIMNTDDYQQFMKVYKDSIDKPQDINGYLPLKMEQNFLLEELNKSYEIEGKTYLGYEVGSMLKNETKLKKDLLSTVVDIDEPILKMRKLYNELNKKLHYDNSFLRDKNININKITTFNNMDSNKSIICKGHAELYQELLVSAGMDSNRVKVVSTPHKKHYWLEVDMDDYIVLADATERLENYIDLVASKLDIETTGFMILPKEFSGTRPSSIVKDINNNTFLEQSKKMVNNIDKQLGYVSNNGYMAKEIKKAKGLFANLNRQGTISETDKLCTIFNMNIPKDMDGYEMYCYNLKIIENLFPEMKQSIKLDNLFYGQGKNTEIVNLLTYYSPNGNNIHQIYSPSFGKQVFNSNNELDDFLIKNYITHR